MCCVVFKRTTFCVAKHLLATAYGPRRNLKQNSFVYDMNDSPCLLCVCLVCTLAVHVQCVCVRACVCVELCVDVCMCTHNCMHMFSVSARCAVDVCSGHV